MANPEQPKSENLEVGQNPEIIANQAAVEILGKGEIQEAVNPDASSEAVQKAKGFFARKTGEFFSWKENKKDIKKYTGAAAVGTFGGVFLAGKMLWGLLSFAKKAIEKKGNITFREGYEIGKKTFDFDARKDK